MSSPARPTLLFVPGIHWGEAPDVGMLTDRIQEDARARSLGVDRFEPVPTFASDRSGRVAPPRPTGFVLRFTRNFPIGPPQPLIAGVGEVGALLVIDPDGRPAFACGRAVCEDSLRLAPVPRELSHLLAPGVPPQEHGSYRFVFRVYRAAHAFTRAE